MAQIQNSLEHIILAGDTPMRLFLYPPDTVSNRNSHVQRPRAYWHQVGVELLAAFLEEGLKNHEHRIHIHKPVVGGLEHGTVHSILELDAHESHVDPRRPAFRMHRMQYIDTVRQWHFPVLPDSVPASQDASIVIFQETKAEKRVTKESADGAIALFEKCRPRFLIYHMAYRLCNGTIWDTVRHGPLTSSTDRDPERLIIVVDADDLRAEGIELSHGLSWEKTCEDFVERLGSVGNLVSLVTCAHLIVLFDGAGVIYHQDAEVAKPILFFDPLSIEGEFRRMNSGYIPGVSDAFIAGFTKGLAESPNFSIEDGIILGLQAARKLTMLGLALPYAAPSPTAPPAEPPAESLGTVYRAAEVLHTNEESKLIRFPIPSDNIARGSEPNWSLLDYMVGDPAEVARQIVRKGALSPANHIPLAQFNQLILFDRREIESFRAIYYFIEEYLSAPMPRPLCIALFGSKGSGKAFNAQQVAEAVSKDRKVTHFRFNISQFTSGDDLLAAFHSIRDSSLGGSTPFVYFNGFDSSFAGSPLGWLPHLVPVMFSGFFSDHGISRPIGSAVFFFGATFAKTYEDLRKRAAGPASDTNRAQEFLACLHGFVNILGPNKADHKRGTDRLYPVRRAVVLRKLLEKREPRLVAGEEINIDEKVLNALLLVPTYRQGIRSLKSIIDMSTLNGRYNFERSSLPPPVQLDLHVDYKTFLGYLNGTPLHEQLREKLAEALHEVYLKERAKTATEEEKTQLKPWKELSEELKESSRAHADSIPSKLREIQSFLSETQEGRKPVTEFTADQVEHLSKIEHQRWNAERLQNQWAMGKERDIKSRKSPFLVPWSDLGEQWRDIDRALVRSYIDILPESHKIYKFGPRE
ncbi:hypothetical protein GGS26DRAFT_270558 [Hypomontagnella submonticulosa]|nr:hypothetical protein GGS26DRAFT_270558 [Hypomontagnella submonticulosa]